MAEPSPRIPPIPDLVRDSQLQTTWRPAYTIHSYPETDRNRRRIIRQEHWEMKRRIGHGSYGQVWLEECTEGKSHGALRAVKMIRRAPGTNTTDYLRELEAAAKFSHPRYKDWFTRSFGWYEDVEAVYIAMEYCPLGDLHSYLSSVPSLPAAEVQELMRQLLEGLHEMHDNGFAHRDLKPKNILIQSRPPDIWWVKLADFGTSRRESDRNNASTVRGTEIYMPPELVFSSGRYSESYNHQAADSWALGEISFQMLTGEQTFSHHGALIDYYRGVRAYPKARLTPLAGADGAHLISRLMDTDPHLRTSATVALRHPWIRSNTADSTQLTISNVAISPLEHIRFPEGDDTGQAQQPSARWSTISQARIINPEVPSTAIESSATALIRPRRPLPVRTKPVRPQSEDNNLQNHSYPLAQSYADPPDIDDIPTNYVPSLPPSDEDALSWEGGLRPVSAPTQSVGTAFNGKWEPLWTLDAGDFVDALAFSSNGKLVVLGSRNGEVTVRDTVSGVKLQTFSDCSPSEVIFVAFYFDNERVFIKDVDRTLRFWNIKSGKVEKTLKDVSSYILSEQTRSSQNGKLIASPLDDYRVMLLDTDSGRKLDLKHRRKFAGLDVSPDGELVGTASEDEKYRVWNARTGVKLHTLKDATAGMFSMMALSSYGGMLLATSNSDIITIRDMTSGAVQTLTSHVEFIIKVTFSPNGTMLASKSTDGAIMLWDTDSWATLHVFRGQSSCAQMVFSPDSRVLAIGKHRHTLELRDTSTGVVLQSLKGDNAAVFSPDSKLLAMQHDRTVELWRYL